MLSWTVAVCVVIRRRRHISGVDREVISASFAASCALSLDAPSAAFMAFCPHATRADDNDFNTETVRDVVSFMFRAAIRRDYRCCDLGSCRKPPLLSALENSRLLKAVT